MAHRDISLREVQRDDLPVFFEHQADAVACRMAGFEGRPWDAFAAHWEANVLGQPGVVTRTVLLRDEVVGNVVCFPQGGRQLVGYWFGRRFWRKGIATRALAAFVEQVSTRPLDAFVWKRNVGSIRVLEKCGFRPLPDDEEPPANDDVEEIVYRLDT